MSCSTADGHLLPVVLLQLPVDSPYRYRGYISVPVYVGESTFDAARAACRAIFGDGATVEVVHDCAVSIEVDIVEHVEKGAAFVRHTIANTSPEYFDHKDTRGMFDAAVGYMQSQVRRDADAQADSLLLLALNKRVANLEWTLRQAVVEVSTDVMAARRTGSSAGSGSGSNSSSSGSVGSGSEPEVAGAWRPDRCLPLYSTFDPAALNVISKVVRVMWRVQVLQRCMCHWQCMIVTQSNS